MPETEVTTQSQLVGTAIVVGVLLLTSWITVFVGRRFVARAMTRGADGGARARTLWIVLRRLIMAALVTTAILFIFQIWGWSITPFLAIGTIVGAAVGFGAQTFVRDVIAGFFILAEDQFHVGDTVTIAGTTGTVEDILLRVTVLRDLEGNMHFVPNGAITVTSNYTADYSQPVIDVQVPYAANLELALAVMQDELDALVVDPVWAEKIRGPAEVLGVDKIGGGTVTLRARIKTVPAERWAVRREAYYRLKGRFDREGING